jgi:ATP-binding cassette subfamily B protein
MRGSTHQPPQGGGAGGWPTFVRLLKFVWPSGRTDLKVRVALALLALLAAKAIGALVPFAFKFAVDGLTQGVDVATGLAAAPIAMIIAYGVGRFATGAFAQLRDAIAARVVEHAVRRLATTSFDHLHRLSLRFHLERRTGGLSRVIERGTNGIEVIVRFSLFNIMPTILELALVGGILAAFLGFEFAAVLVVAIAIYAVFTIRVTEWRVGIRREMNEADSDAYSKAVDSLLNFETVKYFGNEGHESARFDGAMAAYERGAVRTTETLTVLNGGQALIFTAGLVICMVMAANGVLAGQLTVGDFVMVNAYFIQVYVPLNFLGMVHREMRQGFVDLENLFTLLDKDSEIADRPGAPDLAVTDGVVRFTDVRFAYDPERLILKGVSFAVPAGKTVAVVGPSGAGKSTISRLMFRFYEPQGGTIEIDGQEVRSVTQASLRRAIGMVPQDTVLFNDTIGYNICYGRPGAGREEMEQAARLAQLHDFVAGLPRGYDTMVGERGLKLSGGEKQRVAIARTILKAPPILILDEATSALDSFTEREIQAALKNVAQGRTSIVIAHRLSTIIDADEILVLDDGQIAERGTHRGLIAEGGLYAAMWQRQQEAAEAEALLKAVREDKTAAWPASEVETVDR